MAATFPESSLLVWVMLLSVNNEPAACVLTQFSVFSCHSTDPSMTVRTEIKGKYGNRQYAYEPGDMVHREWPFCSLFCHFMAGSAGKEMKLSYHVNLFVFCSSSVLQSMKQARVRLHTEFWRGFQWPLTSDQSWQTPCFRVDLCGFTIK